MTSPIVTWNTTTINGIPCLVIDMAQLVVPLDFDPSSNMFLAVGVPSGGYANLPVLLQGLPGATPTFAPTINLTVLAYNDPTPNSATLTPLGGNVYQAALTIHAAAPGAPGSTTITMSAYGTPVAGKQLLVDPTATTFVYAAPLVGDRFIPSTILSAPSGNPTYTIAQVSIPAQSFAWRPQCSGQTVIAGTGANVQANLVARLNNASTGSIVGMGVGPIGANTVGQATVLSAGPPAGSLSSYDQVPASTPAVVYFNVERQSGTDTFTTTASKSYGFEVVVQPIPGTGI